MTPFKECPLCGGEIVEKVVEKTIRGGLHTASIRVPAEVCLHCGERLYSEDIVRTFEGIRTKLEAGNLAEFKSLGQAVTVSDEWIENKILPAI